MNVWSEKIQWWGVWGMFVWIYLLVVGGLDLSAPAISGSFPFPPFLEPPLPHVAVKGSYLIKVAVLG